MRWNCLLVTMLKDEAPYIDEWMAYYMSIGVDHFIVYDNDSQDGSSGVLTRYINAGRVTCIYWPMLGGQQDAHSHALKSFGQITRWIGFLDLDEYVVLKYHDNLPDYLDSLKCDQVLIPWKNFAHNGHERMPAGATLDNYFWAYQLQAGSVTQVKHFVRPEKVERVIVHFSFLKDGVTKGASGEPRQPTVAVSDPDYGLAQINHYATRSAAENLARLQKGDAINSATKRVEDFRQLTEGYVNLLSYDESILRHRAQFVEERLKWSAAPEMPHRFGLRQTRDMFPSRNHVMFHTATCFSNYIAGLPTLQPHSPLPIVAFTSEGQRDVRGLLGDWTDTLICFQVSTQSVLPYFLGTIHCGDLRRLLAMELSDYRRDMRDLLQVNTSTIVNGSGLLMIADVVSEVANQVTAYQDGERITSQQFPRGRYCIVIYRAFPKLSPVSAVFEKSVNVRELLIGQLA